MNKNIDFPVRQGERPNTKKIQFGHDQLDQHSPAGYRDSIIKKVSNWSGVTIGQSQVSEPSSVGFHLKNSKGPEHGFLYKGTIEFAHIHTTGFLHISIPPPLVKKIIENGWGELHPVTTRPDFNDNILMVYAPTTEKQLQTVLDIIKLSYDYALGN